MSSVPGAATRNPGGEEEASQGRGRYTDNIEPGSTVHTDRQVSYTGISNHDYQHVQMVLSSVPWTAGR